MANPVFKKVIDCWLIIDENQSGNFHYIVN